MEQNEENPHKRRFEDDELECWNSQKLAMQWVPALRQLPSLLDKQTKIDSDVDELRDKLDAKLDKIIDSVADFDRALVKVSERAESQTKEFRRLEDKIKDSLDKIGDLEKVQHGLDIKVNTLETRQNSMLNVLGKLSPWIINALLAGYIAFLSVKGFE